MAKQSLGIYFELFIEIGIIQQLSRALLDSRLPEGFLQSHFSVLNHLLQGRDGSTPLQIAKAFQVPKTTMTHTLSGLQKHGLITIQPNPIQSNPKDGRSKCVWLTTAAGEEFRDQSIAKLGLAIADLPAYFYQQKIADVLPILKELRVHLDENRKE